MTNDDEGRPDIIATTPYQNAGIAEPIHADANGILPPPVVRDRLFSPKPHHPTKNLIPIDPSGNPITTTIGKLGKLRFIMPTPLLPMSVPITAPTYTRVPVIPAQQPPEEIVEEPIIKDNGKKGPQVS